VEAVLDQWDMPPGTDRLFFMERSIESCDFVIVICTPTQADKANRREGGVGYESTLIASRLAEQAKSHKVIPVLRSGDWSSSLPNNLQSKQGVDLRGDPYDQAQYEQLVRTLHGEPVQHPPLGPKPQFAARPAGATTYQGLNRPLKDKTDEAKVDLVKWDAIYPGPCIDVTVTNSRHVIEARPDIGLEYPEPFKTKALLDTGAAVTVISKALAKHCKLYQTGITEIKTLGSLQKCGEYAAAISFPGTSLRPVDPIRIISADFIKEPYHACLIGWDVLRNWKITFDGRLNRVTISD
jgi:TIR domain/gag-polyprotein putative aspartyl protease